MSSNVMLSNKSRGGGERRGFWLPRWPLPRDWLGIGLSVGGGDGFPSHHFFFLPPIKLSLSLPTSFLAFILPVLSLIPLWGQGERASSRVGAWLLARVNPPQQSFCLYLDATLNIVCLMNNVGGLCFATLGDHNVENGNILQQKLGLLQV